MEMKAESEVIVAISADDIERNKRRGDLGITYDMEALRLIDAFRACGLYVGGVCITHCREQDTVSQFQKRLEALNVPVYRHYIIPDYPANLPADRIARRLRQERFYRNDPPARRCDRARPRQRQNGDVSFPALSSSPAR